MPEDTAGEPVFLPRSDGDHGGGGDGGNVEEFSHDSTDWVSIKMGPNIATLHHVADINNVANEDLGEVNSGRIAARVI